MAFPPSWDVVRSGSWFFGGCTVTVLGKELDAGPAVRRLGSGWISGVVGLVLAVIGLGTVLCLRYPEWLTMPEARGYYNVPIIRIALHLVLILAFFLGMLSIVLRQSKA